MFIDADTHIGECDDTWSYIPKSQEAFRPAMVSFDHGAVPSYLPKDSYAWFIDGKVYFRVPASPLSGTSAESFELRDVPARLKDMDELNVATQVMYPTTYLHELTRRPEIEVALCQSYNRWLADRCAESGGRLRWVALAPLNSLPDALTEIRWAREHGACGVFKRSVECGDRLLTDPYFFPLYALAVELDMPMCVHGSFPYREVEDKATNFNRQLRATNYAQDAFFRVADPAFAARFPKLRIGFIELGCGWLSYVLWLGRIERTKHGAIGPGSKVEEEREKDPLGSRLFVTCEISENLRQIISEVGDTNLLVGSDYGHADRAGLLAAQSMFLEHPEFSRETGDRFTRLNVAKFYGLDAD